MLSDLRYLGSGLIPPHGELTVRRLAFLIPFRIQRAARGGPDLPETLLPAAARLGGRPWDRGDVSAVVPAFPRVEVHVVLYRGDDDFPPAATMLFSSDIASFQSAEDVAVLGGATVSRLARALSGP